MLTKKKYKQINWMNKIEEKNTKKKKIQVTTE